MTASTGADTEPDAGPDTGPDTEPEAGAASRPGSRIAVEAVASGVRDGIVRGRYAPGQRLLESDLAAEHHASRGAVRSALVQLENEGVVLREPNRGARVRAISLEEAVEITEARAVVEGLCAAKAASRATDDDRERLRLLGVELRDAVERSDVTTYSRVNQQVHHAVRDIAGHGIAGALLDRLRTQSVRYHYTVALLPGRPSVGLTEHLAVIDTVCAGDPDVAESTMREHLMSVVEALRQIDASTTHHW